MNPAVVLSINASDPTGFGGLEADQRTFAAHNVHAATVVTAVGGPSEHYAMPGNVVGGELSVVLAELKPAAVKVGVVATAEIAGAVAVRCRAGELPNLVLDPVLDTAGGHKRGVIGAILRLMPDACVMTPNVDEAGELVGWPVITTADMAGAAGQLISRGAKYVVITGGRLAGDESIDAIWTDGGVRFLNAPRVEATNIRGTGSTFSAAITAQLALGANILEAVMAAKTYVTNALAGSRDWQIGYHCNPLDNLMLSMPSLAPTRARPVEQQLALQPAAVATAAATPEVAKAPLVGRRSGIPLPDGSP
jgi:hydroxymethylpyrimidine kinase/phosphomethylpyrimidine kinase